MSLFDVARDLGTQTGSRLTCATVTPLQGPLRKFECTLACLGVPATGMNGKHHVPVFVWTVLCCRIRESSRAIAGSVVALCSLDLIKNAHILSFWLSNCAKTHCLLYGTDCILPATLGQNITGLTCVPNGRLKPGSSCTVKCVSANFVAANAESNTYSCSLAGVLQQPKLTCTPKGIAVDALPH